MRPRGDNEQLLIALRYSAGLVGVVLLVWHLVLDPRQNVIVLSLIALSLFLLMTNRLTQLRHEPPRGLTIIFATYSLAILMLFVDEVAQLTISKQINSTVFVIAMFSGIGGAYLAYEKGMPGAR